MLFKITVWCECFNLVHSFFPHANLGTLDPFNLMALSTHKSLSLCIWPLDGKRESRERTPAFSHLNPEVMAYFHSYSNGKNQSHGPTSIEGGRMVVQEENDWEMISWLSNHFPVWTIPQEGAQTMLDIWAESATAALPITSFAWSLPSLMTDLLAPC